MVMTRSHLQPTPASRAWFDSPLFYHSDFACSPRQIPCRELAGLYNLTLVV